MVKLPAPLDQIRPRLEAAFGGRLRGIVLYGSRARGDHRPDSDLDLMVLLEGPIALYADMHTATEALYPLQLELDYSINALPHDAGQFQTGDFALFREARRDGVAL